VIDDNEETTKMLQDFFEIKDIEHKVINEGLEELNELYKDDIHYNCIVLDLTIHGFSESDIFRKIQSKNILKSKNKIYLQHL
jgi:DNA-binding response OmpR family regulator